MKQERSLERKMEEIRKNKINWKYEVRVQIKWKERMIWEFEI